MENHCGFAVGNVTYLSRANGFANYAQATAAPSDFALHGEVTGNGTYDPNQYNNADDVMSTTGARNGLELYDLRGADYDNPRWEQLLDHVTVAEMVDLIAFGGRDFEYYSEDSLLSAKMAVAKTKGILDAGMYPFIKHFALNEQETNRNALLCTWTNEQAMREIYLKPFEECVKAYPDGKIAIMSSYNYIGTTWAGGCSALLQDVLRGEWGFKGMVHYFGNYGYMDADKAVRGGTDIMLGTAGNEAIMTDQTSATSLLAMRQATRNIFYTTVNSTAYENYTPGSIPGWLMTAYIVDGVIIAALAVLEFFTIRSYLKKKDRV